MSWRKRISERLEVLEDKLLDFKFGDVELSRARASGRRKERVEKALEEAIERGERAALIEAHLDKNEVKDLMEKGYRVSLTKKGWLLKWD
jgi:hypothetical protein